MRQKYKKARVGETNSVIIIPDYYSSSVSHILEMAEILKVDYPELTNKDLKIYQCGPPVNENKLLVEAVVDDPLPEYEPYRTDFLYRK
jgi:hypothetical protein